MSLIEPGIQYVDAPGWEGMVNALDAERRRGLWWLEPATPRGPMACAGYAMRMTAARCAAARQTPEEARITIEMAELEERARELRARGLDWETAAMQSQYETEGS